jgi:hypothetical protein
MEIKNYENNIFGVSIIFKITVLIISIPSMFISIYLFIRSIREIDTFGDQKYLIIIPILYFIIVIYCFLILRYKVIYYDKIIIFKYVLLKEIVDLNKFKYFKIDYRTLPVSYLLYYENKTKKKRIHYIFKEKKLFYDFLLKNMEEIE